MDALPLRLALTKGRLEKQCRAVLSKTGYDTAALEATGRRLLHSLPAVRQGLPPLEAVLAKAPDVITYVEHGVCAMGIAGKDSIMEQGGSFYELLDLGLGRCRFALAAPGGVDFFGGTNHKRIATKYPGMTRAWLDAEGMDAELIRIEGSVELAPMLGLADGIADIVETGDTLKANGLEVIHSLFDISARLIVNVAAYKLRRREIEYIVTQMGELL